MKIKKADESYKMAEKLAVKEIFLQHLFIIKLRGWQLKKNRLNVRKNYWKQIKKFFNYLYKI